MYQTKIYHNITWTENNNTRVLQNVDQHRYILRVLVDFGRTYAINLNIYTHFRQNPFWPSLKMVKIRSDQHPANMTCYLRLTRSTHFAMLIFLINQPVVTWTYFRCRWKKKHGRICFDTNLFWLKPNRTCFKLTRSSSWPDLTFICQAAHKGWKNANKKRT